MFDAEKNLLLNKTFNILFTIDSIENNCYISYGNYCNSLYPSMKGIIYESRFSIYPSSSWSKNSLFNYL